MDAWSPRERCRWLTVTDEPKISTSRVFRLRVHRSFCGLRGETPVRPYYNCILYYYHWQPRKIKRDPDYWYVETFPGGLDIQLSWILPRVPQAGCDLSSSYHQIAIISWFQSRTRIIDSELISIVGHSDPNISQPLRTSGKRLRRERIRIQTSSERIESGI